MAVKLKTELFISEKWRDFFRKNGLSVYEDFFENRKDQVLIAEEKNTTILKMDVKDNTFFLKRKYPEKLKKIFRYLLKGKGIRNPVKQEVQNLAFLEEAGFQVMKVAAWGIRKKVGFPTTSFILSEEVKGEDFQKLYEKSNTQQRKKMYEDFGRLSAEIHTKGIDTLIRLQDLFCIFENGKLSMTLIDREEGSGKKINYSEKRICLDLVKIFYKLVKKSKRVPLTPKEMMYFCKQYTENSRIISKSPKEFFILLNKELIDFMQGRKSNKAVQNILDHARE